MSNLKEFEKLFKACGIEYGISEDIKNTEKSVMIDEYYSLGINGNYESEKADGWGFCTFYFNKDGKFLWFGCYD